MSPSEIPVGADQLITIFSSFMHAPQCAALETPGKQMKVKATHVGVAGARRLFALRGVSAMRLRDALTCFGAWSPAGASGTAPPS